MKKKTYRILGGFLLITFISILTTVITDINVIIQETILRNVFGWLLIPTFLLGIYLILKGYKK